MRIDRGRRFPGYAQREAGGEDHQGYGGDLERKRCPVCHVVPSLDLSRQLVQIPS